MFLQHLWSITLSYLLITSLLIDASPVSYSALEDVSPTNTNAMLADPYYQDLPVRRQLTMQSQLPAPGQQVQNPTGTQGAGNGTGPAPGFIMNSPTTSSDTNCSDLRTGRDNKCWAELNLTEWVHEWVAVNPCRQNEAFATCFLRLEGFFGLDCTGIKPDACTAPQSDNLATQPQVAYVAYNIYAINQFFLSWYNAVLNSAVTAALNVDGIVQIIDPPSDTNLILDNILIALTGIFAVLPGPLKIAADTAGIAKSVTTEFTLAASFVEDALLALPQIGRYLFPIDTSASQIVQISQLKAQLENVMTTVQNNLNKTVVSVMTNVTEFLAFASQGNFTASAPSLPDQANHLLYGFNTYIISAALNGNNVKGTLGWKTDPHALATNGSHLAYPIDCAHGYNAQGVCDTWWYSTAYGSAFGLDDFAHMDRNYNSILTSLFSNYTTGELLFEAALACNTQGGFGQGVNVSVNAAGVNTACLSQLQIATWDMHCTRPIATGQCEFVEIPKQNLFLGNCGSHSAYSVMDEPVYCVSHDYLGPLITEKYALKRK